MFTQFLTFRLSVVRTADDLNKYMFIPLASLMDAWEGFECSKIEVISNTREDTLFNGMKLLPITDWNSFLDTLPSLGNQDLSSLFTDTFEEITEEEFYKDITTLF